MQQNKTTTNQVLKLQKIKFTNHFHEQESHLSKVPGLYYNSQLRAVKTFLSSRQIMNSRWLWNSHQGHKFLRAAASRDFLNLIKNSISRGLQEIFSTAVQFHQNTCKSGNNAVKMCQVSQDIARFDCFTDLNLFKYAFNVIQNWETDVLQFYLMVLNFLFAVMNQKEMKVAGQGWLTSRRFCLATGRY